MPRRGYKQCNDFLQPKIDVHRNRLHSQHCTIQQLKKKNWQESLSQRTQKHFLPGQRKLPKCTTEQNQWKRKNSLSLKKMQGRRCNFKGIFFPKKVHKMGGELLLWWDCAWTKAITPSIWWNLSVGLHLSKQEKVHQTRRCHHPQDALWAYYPMIRGIQGEGP